MESKDTSSNKTITFPRVYIFISRLSTRQLSAMPAQDYDHPRSSTSTIYHDNLDIDPFQEKHTAFRDDPTIEQGINAYPDDDDGEGYTVESSRVCSFLLFRFLLRTDAPCHPDTASEQVTQDTRHPRRYHRFRRYHRCARCVRILGTLFLLQRRDKAYHHGPCV